MRSFRGIGTAVNVYSILIGSGLGVLLGHRLSERTRDLVTPARCSPPHHGQRSPQPVAVALLR